MRKRFYFVMALFFWLLMVIGFSDNWLFDVKQESNGDPRMLIHAFFAFSWFTLLVLQTGLVLKGRVKTHIALGIAGMVSYAGFFCCTSFLYVVRWRAEGVPDSLGQLNIALFVFATFLIAKGFWVRNKDQSQHKTNIMVGTFMLMEPGISRTLGHLIGKGSEPIWLLTYLVLFALFCWHFKKINWQLGTGFLIWMIGTINIIAAMG